MHVGSPPVTFLEVILQTSVYHAADHREPICTSNAYKADHKQEERQTLLLERIIKNVDLLNEALMEMNRSFADINNHNQDITIVAEMWNGYHRNVDFNLQNMESNNNASNHHAM